MNYQSIIDPADLVIRSSADDRGHCNADMIPGQPTVVTATDIGPEGVVVRGLRITAAEAQESLIHKEHPLDNAMYCFALEGVRIAHLGDVGNRLTAEQLAALAGNDVVLVPTGGPPTLDLDDLMDALRELRPHVIIPMHYQLPTSKPAMLPVTEFTGRFPAEAVLWAAGPEIELTQLDMPEGPRVIVLQASAA
jgi:L-ascorbate metabolism protein UlaG (beta-lactamase superfamily)